MCEWSTPSVINDSTAEPRRNGRDTLTNGPFSRGRVTRGVRRKQRTDLVQKTLNRGGICRELVGQKAADDFFGVNDGVQAHGGVR
jgi:hypothetical protein